MKNYEWDTNVTSYFEGNIIIRKHNDTLFLYITYLLRYMT